METRSNSEAPRSRRAVVIAAPAVLAVGALAAVPLLTGSSDDAIESATPTSTTSATATTVDTSTDDDVFTAAGGTTSDVEVTTTSTIAPTTSSTAAPATTVPITVAETLPEQPPAPIAPPADPRGAEDQILLGGISIPKLDVDAPLLEGIRLTTLDNGPGHWPGTAMPGEVGNVVVAAHRTSHGAPFRDIDQLVVGDSVLFETAAGEVEYLVTGSEIVEPTALWIVDPTDTPTATLFACHPPGSVAERIVVYLELA